MESPEVGAGWWPPRGPLRGWRRRRWRQWWWCGLRRYNFDDRLNWAGDVNLDGDWFRVLCSGRDVDFHNTVLVAPADNEHKLLSRGTHTYPRVWEAMGTHT